jgi:hypothetical protein
MRAARTKDCAGMAEPIDRTTKDMAWGAGAVLVPAVLAGAVLAGAVGLAALLQTHRAAFGLVGGVILEPVAWLLEGFGWALALLFALAAVLSAKSLAQASLGQEYEALRHSAARLQLYAIDTAHACLGPTVLVMVAAVVAGLVFPPAVVPEAFLGLLLGLLMLLAAPLLWAGRGRADDSGLKQRLATAARALALADGTAQGDPPAPAWAAHLRNFAMLALVALSSVAVALRERPPAWAWMPALKAGQAGQIDPAAYADRRGELARAPLTPFVQSLRVRGDYLEIFYPFDPLYHPYAIGQRCPDLPARAEPGHAGEAYWRGQLLACISRLHVIRLNGSTLSGAEWQVSLDPPSGQRGYRALVPISGISPGVHRLEIERPAPGSGDVIETDEAPYSIPFWRE